MTAKSDTSEGPTKVVSAEQALVEQLTRRLAEHHSHLQHQQERQVQLKQQCTTLFHQMADALQRKSGSVGNIVSSTADHPTVKISEGSAHLYRGRVALSCTLSCSSNVEEDGYCLIGCQISACLLSAPGRITLRIHQNGHDLSSRSSSWNSNGRSENCEEENEISGYIQVTCIFDLPDEWSCGSHHPLQIVWFIQWSDCQRQSSPSPTLTCPGSMSWLSSPLSSLNASDALTKCPRECLLASLMLRVRSRSGQLTFSDVLRWVESIVKLSLYESKSSQELMQSASRCIHKWEGSSDNGELRIGIRERHEEFLVLKLLAFSDRIALGAVYSLLHSKKSRGFEVDLLISGD